MIQPESIAVVLPVHGRKHLTLACLRGLTRQRISGFKVIVVDSGSTDGTADAVEAEFPSMTVLRHGNLWWSGATNKGVERAIEDHARYILTINDDLELEEGYLESMVRAAECHPLALMGSYAFDFDTRRPIYCGERMNWISARARKLLDGIPPERRRGLLKVSYYSARGLWVPAEVFAQIGLFDARRLPHYVADLDLTARAVSAGFEMYVNCDAILFNRQDQSGAREAMAHYSWHNYRKHLFGIQGAGNLRNFTIFALRHCPRRYLPLFWSIGVLRCAGGYLRDWTFSKVARPLPAK